MAIGKRFSEFHLEDKMMALSGINGMRVLITFKQSSRKPGLLTLGLSNP